jgi:hypothetical protein
MPPEFTNDFLSPAPTMRDPLFLLHLTADLHAATRNAARWPQAWAALCDWFDCPDVFGAVIPPGADDDGWLQRLGHCARTACGPCGHGPTADEGKRRACLATVGHLRQAAISPPPRFLSKSGGTRPSAGTDVAVSR